MGQPKVFHIGETTRVDWFSTKDSHVDYLHHYSNWDHIELRSHWIAVHIEIQYWRFSRAGLDYHEKLNMSLLELQFTLRSYQKNMAWRLLKHDDATLCSWSGCSQGAASVDGQRQQEFSSVFCESGSIFFMSLFPLLDLLWPVSLHLWSICRMCCALAAGLCNQFSL